MKIQQWKAVFEMHDNNKCFILAVIPKNFVCLIAIKRIPTYQVNYNKTKLFNLENDEAEQNLYTNWTSQCATHFRETRIDVFFLASHPDLVVVIVCGGWGELCFFLFQLSIDNKPPASFNFAPAQTKTVFEIRRI
jgi:hypothetical protein